MEELANVKDILNMKHPYTIKLLSSLYEYRKNINKDSIEEINNDGILSGCPYYGRCNSSKPICKMDSPDLVEVSEGHKIACHLNT